MCMQIKRFSKSNEDCSPAPGDPGVREVDRAHCVESTVSHSPCGQMITLSGRLRMRMRLGEWSRWSSRAKQTFVQPANQATWFVGLSTSRTCKAQIA